MAKVCSFTTDVWSADSTVASLFSFTVHCLTESFERKTSVLNVTLIDGSHTGEYLATKYNKMLSTWETPLDRIHLVRHDYL